MNPSKRTWFNLTQQLKKETLFMILDLTARLPSDGHKEQAVRVQRGRLYMLTLYGSYKTFMT